MPRPAPPRALRVLHACFHRPETAGWVAVQSVVAVLVVISIGLLAFELAAADDAGLPPDLQRVDDLILWVFVIEFSLRVLTYRPPEVDFYAGGPLVRARWAVLGRLRFMLRPLNVADALATIAVIPALRGLRALRLLRLLRGARLFRFANPFAGLARAFVDNRLPFLFAFGFLTLAVVMFGTTIFLVEHRHNAGVETLVDGYWWAIVTITTVGFGDIAPVTAMGRAIAAVLMVVGMFTLALFAGIVGQTMLSVVLLIREEEFRMAGYVNHLVICGYDPACRRLLQEVTAEVGSKFEGRLVVFAKGERPTDLPPEYAWVDGDPTRENDLEKVRMRHAATAIIVGSRALSPQQADAASILTAFTIRRMVRGATQSGPAREHPLYLIAEILDSENVEHARVAGCDEVIETTRLGFSLLAHATSMPGTASILSQVAARGAQSLYVGRRPGGAVLPFVDVARQLKEELGVLVVGVRDANGKARVNPEASYSVPADSELLYFAESPKLPLSERASP